MAPFAALAFSEGSPRYVHMLPTDTSREDEAAASQPDGQALGLLLTEPHAWAVFLDIDGTLIDLADTPEGIVVPEDLPAHL